MAASGRDFLIKKNGLAIAGVKENSVSFSAEGVDVTDKMDAGYVTYGDFAGTLSFEITGSGVQKDTTLRDIFKTGGGFLLTDVTLEFENGESWACDVFFSSYSETGAHDGSIDFEFTMSSSGAWEVTP